MQEAGRQAMASSFTCTRSAAQLDFGLLHAARALAPAPEQQQQQEEQGAADHLAQPAALAQMCGHMDERKVGRAWIAGAREKPLQITGPPGVGKRTFAQLLAAEAVPPAPVVVAFENVPPARKRANVIIVGGSDGRPLADARGIRLKPVPEAILYYWLLRKGYSDERARKAARVSRGDVRRALIELSLPTPPVALAIENIPSLEDVFWLHIPQLDNIQTHAAYAEEVSLAHLAGETDWRLSRAPRRAPLPLARRKKRITPAWKPQIDPYTRERMVAWQRRLRANRADRLDLDEAEREQ